MPEIGLVTLLVRDYDEAIEYFTSSLGFVLAEDMSISEGKRWVRVTPTGAGGTALLLAKAANPEQEARIGDQAGRPRLPLPHDRRFLAGLSCNGHARRHLSRRTARGSLRHSRRVRGSLRKQVGSDRASRLNRLPFAGGCASRAPLVKLPRAE
jgi:catechol 2,3-dioxygenase-like lactoylglutathione lyase family enzyme